MEKLLKSAKDFLLGEGVRWIIQLGFAMLISGFGFVMGYLEGIPIAYLIPATLFAVGSALWITNQLYAFFDRMPEAESIKFGDYTTRAVRLRDYNDQAAISVSIFIVNLSNRSIQFEVVEQNVTISRRNGTAVRKSLPAQAVGRGILAPMSQQEYELPQTVIEDILGDDLIGQVTFEVKFGRAGLRHTISTVDELVMAHQGGANYSYVVRGKQRA